MCGIIGATGSEPVLPVLLEGLARLEYRGYDSAGVALMADDGVWRRRRAGGNKSVAELTEAVGDAPPATTGIGHSRWATHGAPTKPNAHPHTDATGRLALAHNGIIENYRELARTLPQGGDEVTSDTDTEVLAHLVAARLHHGQPAAVRETLLGRIVAGRLVLDQMRLSDDDVRQVDKVFVVATGSSYHAGMVGRLSIEHFAQLPTELEIASEFRYRDPVLDSSSLVVAISQSGETLDTMEAVAHTKAMSKARVLAVTNVVDSSLGRDADATLYTRAGPEVAVASTKCHVAQLVAMHVLALYLAQVRGKYYPEEVAHQLACLQRLPDRVQADIDTAPAVTEVARRVEGARDFFFIGRGVGNAMALEGALKLKEISYLRAEGYPAGELKHGPIALIEPGVVVVAIATRSRLRA